MDLSVPGPDYVFEKDYHLPSLEELTQYIHAYKHLPGVPTAKEMNQEGIELGVMNMILLKKIEELTLYVIKLQSENQKQDDMIRQLMEKKLVKDMRFLLIALFLLLNVSSFAQTNTFPASGDAGIGTITPNAPLHIVPVGSSAAWLALDKGSTPSNPVGPH